METGEVTSLAEARPVDIVAYNPNEPTSLYLNAGMFAQMQRVAHLMASSTLVPKHLQGKLADCFLVCSQAIRWNMDPFAAAQHIYIVHGKVGWEGKIVAAIVNSRLGKKLNYKYSGKKGTRERSVVISGSLKGEDEPREVEGSVGEWSTDNEQWKTPSAMDQMLAYRGAREWARRYMPEAVLGVYSDDEVEAIALKEADSVTDATLDDFLNPAKTTSEEDPSDEPKKKEPPKPKKETKAEPPKEEKPKRPRRRIPKKAKPEPKPEPVEVEPEEEDEPNVTTEEPKQASDPDPEPADDESDPEIDALFS
jgi:hypothetical protein